MLVPTAENDRFRIFRRGSIVDPCGRVDTRPYKALRRRGAVVDPCGRVGTRHYKALRRPLPGSTNGRGGLKSA